MINKSRLRKGMTSGLRKKGFAVQFNWLFVLIAGAIILVFFVSLINIYFKEEVDMSDIEATKELEILIKNTLASGNTQKTIPFNNKKTFFYCKEISEFHVGNSQRYGRYDYNAIFTPYELDGTELVLQSSVFEAPFKTIPLLYITNKDIEYVFVTSAPSPLMNTIYTSMPENTTKNSSFLNLANYNDYNFDHTVFIMNASEESLLYSPVPLTLNRFRNPERRVYAVVIHSGRGAITSYGKLSFYSYEDTGFVKNGEVPFLGINFILGGIISHNKTIYNCTIEKVLKRVELLSEMHRLRADYYYENAPDECKDYYLTASGYLEFLKQKTSEKNFSSMVILISQIRKLNEVNLSKLTACPPIY